jgi:hypothetical protein
MNLGRFDTLARQRHGVWEGGANLMAGYAIWSEEIRLWWSRTKRERPRCGARCRDGNPCEVPPVWDRRMDRPLNGRCRMQGASPPARRRKRDSGV